LRHFFFFGLLRCDSRRGAGLNCLFSSRIVFFAGRQVNRNVDKIAAISRHRFFKLSAFLLFSKSCHLKI
jgi:hypothetical protein